MQLGFKHTGGSTGKAASQTICSPIPPFLTSSGISRLFLEPATVRHSVQNMILMEPQERIELSTTNVPS